MKKLKLTIAGEVKTFDLPENGEYNVEVVDKYVPQVGDCVMVSVGDLENATFFKIASINDEGNIRFKNCIDFYKGKYTLGLVDSWFLDQKGFTQITPEELKAKYIEAGYDWDYERDTIKSLKWIPKDGDEVWWLNSIYEPVKSIFDKDDAFFQLMAERGLLFQTKEKSIEFADHCMSYINNKKE